MAVNDAAKVIPALCYQALVFAPQRLRWYHAGASLVNWCVEPGQVFRAGDPLYAWVAHQRLESCAAAGRIESAPADGILLYAACRAGQRLQPGSILGRWIGLAEWLAYAALLKRQEQAIKRFLATGRWTAADPAPVLEKCRQLRAQCRQLQEAMPALRQEEATLRREWATERRHATLLAEQEKHWRPTAAAWRQQYPLAALLGAVGAGELPETGAAEAARLPGLLREFLQQQFALGPAEAALLAEAWRAGAELAAAYDAFGRERNAIAARHAPDSPLLKADLKALRRECQKYLTAALTALARPPAPLNAETAGGAAGGYRDTPASETPGRTTGAESA
jgi:hypothetical protein